MSEFWNLRNLQCSYNFIKEIPILPDSIFMFRYQNNPIYDFNCKYFDRNLTDYLRWKQNWEKKFVHKIENWFLECKGNPKYAYCRRYVNGMYDQDYPTTNN